MLFLAQHLWNFSEAPATEEGKRVKSGSVFRLLPAAAALFVVVVVDTDCLGNALSDHSYDTPQSFG